MLIAYTIVAGGLALMLLFSAFGKLTRREDVVKTITGIGVPLSWFPWLAGCLIAGALGLLFGVRYAALGIAAAVGLVIYFLAAVTAHRRVGDVKGSVVPLALATIAAVALALRLVSS